MSRIRKYAVYILLVSAGAPAVTTDGLPGSEGAGGLRTGEEGEEKLPPRAPEERSFGPRSTGGPRVVVGRVTDVAGDRLKLNLGIDFDIVEGDTLEVYRRIDVVHTVTEQKVKLTWRVGRVFILESAGSSSIGRFESLFPCEEVEPEDEVRAVVPEEIIRAGSGEKR